MHQPSPPPSHHTSSYLFYVNRSSFSIFRVLWILFSTNSNTSFQSNSLPPPPSRTHTSYKDCVFLYQVHLFLPRGAGCLLSDQKVRGSIPGSNLLCSCQSGGSISHIQAHEADFTVCHPVFRMRR